MALAASSLFVANSATSAASNEGTGTDTATTDTAATDTAATDTGTGDGTGVDVTAPAENLPPQAVISMSHPPGPLTIGTPLTLDASGSTDPEGEQLSYEWYVYTGNSNVVSTDEVYVHRFGMAGDFDLALVVTDASGASSRANASVTVTNTNGAPTASFDFSPKARVTTSTKVSFDASGSTDPDGDSLTYEWWADDSGASTLVGTSRNFDYTFSTVGTHEMRLVVTDSVGASNATSQAVEIIGDDPVASFTFAPRSPVRLGSPVTFDGSTSFDPLGGNLSYEWRIEGAPGVIGTSPTLEHTFETAGEFDVVLTVANPAGKTGSSTVAVAVNTPPIAAFTRAPSTSPIVTGTKVTFDASGSYDPDGEVVNLEWRVAGQSGVAIGEVFEFTFTTPGSVGVELRVKDASGAVTRTREEIMVVGSLDPPVARFTQTPSSPKIVPETKVTFDARASTGDDLTYAWRVRGETGIYSTDKVLNYTFDKAASYGVELTVTDSAGRSATQWTGLEVRVPVLPVARFTATPATQTVIPNTKIDFDARTSTGEDLTYEWYVSGRDGIVSADQKASLTFADVGVYRVELRVTDWAGNKSKQTAQIEVRVPNPPEVRVAQVPSASTVIPGTRVTFDASASTGDRLTYAWRISGETGVYSIDKVLNYKFANPGSYRIQLTVADSVNQTAVMTTELEVRLPDPPVARLSQTPAVNKVLPGTTVTFDASASTGEGLTYAWKVRGETGVYSTDKVLNYKFAKAGDYGVELHVTDRAGQTSKQWVGLEARVPDPPVARLSQTPAVNKVLPGTTVTFDASASTGEGLTYAWKVRGETGVYSTDKVLNYKFAKAGDYGVELHVTDWAGNTAKYWVGLEARVPNPPVARFNQAPAVATVAPGTTVTFDGSTSSGEGLTYAWYVRGETGVYSTDKVLNYRFTNAGKYGIELRVTDWAGTTSKYWVGLEAA